MWMLGIEPGSSGRAASGLTGGTVFPVPMCAVHVLCVCKHAGLCLWKPEVVKYLTQSLSMSLSFIVGLTV